MSLISLLIVTFVYRVTTITKQPQRGPFGTLRISTMVTAKGDVVVVNGSKLEQIVDTRNELIRRGS